MKKFLKLIPALCMLLIAAILVSTATYAWFSMNTEVTAKDMKVRVVAEKGLLINEVATANDSHWDEEATAAQTASNVVLLYPSSTADGSTWYHGASKKSYHEAGASSGAVDPDLIGGAYTTLSSLSSITAFAETATAGTKAARQVMGDSATAEAGYYAHYTYYLKGAAGTAIALGQNAGDMNVYIKSVTATPLTSNSADLNKSLRVGIKLNSDFYIYAPITGYTSTYYVAAGTTATTPIAGTTATATDLASLPAANGTAATVDVYLWYEGEDANCMSDNALAATLDAINVDIVFELAEVPTPTP